MKKKYKPPTKHKQSTKQKHLAERSITTSLPASSSASNISIKQKHFEQLEKILLTPLKDDNESTMGDFIVKHILDSLSATNITNGQKIKYTQIIEKFLLTSIHKINKTAYEAILYNLVFIREHLKQDEESVIKYLLNSEVLGEKAVGNEVSEGLFDHNRLDNDKLTLLDCVESLQDVLKAKDKKKNTELIKWLKEKGAKHSSEILLDFNKEDYDKNVENLKKQLENYPIKSQGGVRSRFEHNVSKELLECFDVILNNKIINIPERMNSFLNVYNNVSSEVCIVSKLLRECYKDIDTDNYIKIINSLLKEKIPSDLLKMSYYEELIGLYIAKIWTLTLPEEKLLDEYTSKLVALTLKNNSGVTDDRDKYDAYKKRLNYCKYKKDLKETIEVSLELMKYADDTEREEVLYGLLVALYGIEIGSFKDKLLADLVDKFELSGEAREMFTNLFSCHYVDPAVAKKIQQDLKIIEQACSECNPGIRAVITKFSDAFIMQIGKCSVSTMQGIVNNPNFESATPESILNILSCLKNWSKNKIEQVDYQKVLNKLLKMEHLKKDTIANIKLAEFYLAIEDLVQTKDYLDSAEKLLKAPTLRHTFFQQAAMNPKVYLSEYVKLGFMLKAFEGKNEGFLKANLGYIKETYDACNAIKEKLSSAYQNVLDICQHHLLSREPTTDPNLGEQLKNIIHNIAEDDEVTFSLEIINQNISKEQQIVILKGGHINEPSCDSIEADNTATTQEDSLYKENFVTKCLSHATIIHRYYQNLKKSTQSFHDNISDLHQENYQIWNISDTVSYTTKNEGSSTSIVCNIGKKHNNIYAVINPDLLGSLQESQKKAFSAALTKGIVNKSYNQHGVKILGKYLPELKIVGGTRLYATKIYNNDNGAVLIEFNEKDNHTGVRNAFKYTTIDVIKVSGVIDHHTQEEDSTLKYNVPQEDYPDIEGYLNLCDEVSCIGEES